ncbi:hypothetical protein AWW67_00420 [Roseivirga seohaensis]|uniref:HTH LytTR-type domain-containing protein n=2 Tax=Roseivirga seohaensis TaxID=1914963 RepID=A0A150Y467_9BACT|nr:hypothetical protein AWW67_00420 [Roseivirga seohaensis]
MIKHSRQVIFWVFVFAFLNLLFGLKWSNYLDSFYFTSMLMPVAIATSYFFNLFLVPQYLEAKRYFWFALYTFYTVVVSVFLSGLIAMAAFVFLTDFNWNRMSPVAGDILQLGVIIYFVAILFSFIRVYRSNLERDARIAALEEANQKNLLQTITVRSNREAVSISVDDILYIESLADYVKINTLTGVVITKEKISGLEKMLPEWFIRIHRSYLVNKNKVEAFGHDYVKVQAQQLPVGRKYKKEALERINNNKELTS